MSKIYQCPEKDMSNLAKKKQQINKQKNRERKRILSWEGQRSGTELNAGLSDLRLNAG